KIDLGSWNTKAAEIADEGLELFNVFVPPGLPELDLQRPVVVDDPAVDLDPVAAQPLLGALDHLIVSVIGKLGVDPAHPDRLQNTHFVTGQRTNVHQSGILGVARIVFVLGWGAGADSREARRSAGGERECQEIAPAGPSYVARPSNVRNPHGMPPIWSKDTITPDTWRPRL